MKKIILSFALLSTAFTANAATIVLQSGNPAVEIRVSTTAALVPATGGVVLGFIRGYTAAMNPSLAGDGQALRDFIAQNFVPIGRLGSDPDHGTNSVANPVSLRPHPTVVGGSTSAGTIENSTWLTSGGAIVANSYQDGGLVRGTRIFMFAYAGTSLETASDLGIYSASTWALPASAAVNTLSMALTQVDLATEVYRGSLGSLVLAPIVPEPSSSLMALIAGLGMIARRRR